MAAFKGFPKDFTAFFRELKANSDRGGFEANRPRYPDSAVRPMPTFIET